MLYDKAKGLILSIDQASNAAGVSLWRDNVLIATTVLKSLSSKDPFGRRLIAQVKQLTEFLNKEIGDEKIEKVLFEGVKSRLVLIVIGAFCTCHHLQDCKIVPKTSFIYPLQWKRYMASLGAKGKVSEIKGVKALQDIGWPFDKYPIDSEDIADSISIYLTWRSKP